MEDIRFYDWEFNLIHIETRIISANWQVYYNAVGTFEAHFALQSPVVGVVMQNPYIVAMQGDFTATITGKQANTDFAVFGRTCNWILTKRTTPQFKTTDLITRQEITRQDVETVTRYLVQQAFLDAPAMTLGDVIGLDTEIPFWRLTRNITGQVIIDCLENDNAGHAVIFDVSKKVWVYQVLRGKTQNLIISEANRNADNLSYNADFLEYASGGWYEHHPEPEEGVLVVDDPETEWIYVDAGHGKTGLYHWETVLTGLNESEAKSNLKTKKIYEAIKAKTHSLRLGIDYELGDLVSIQLQKGSYQKTIQKRITGAHIWYESEETGQEPILEGDENGV